jgi:hypothetical protein
MITILVSCPRHRQYKGLRRPLADCRECRLIYNWMCKAGKDYETDLNIFRNDNELEIFSR